MPSKIVDPRHSLTEVATERCSLKITVRLVTHKLYYITQFLLGGPDPKQSKLSIKKIYEERDMLHKSNPLTKIANIRNKS